MHGIPSKYNIFVPCDPQFKCCLSRCDVDLDSEFLSPGVCSSMWPPDPVYSEPFEGTHTQWKNSGKQWKTPIPSALKNVFGAYGVSSVPQNLKWREKRVQELLGVWRGRGGGWVSAFERAASLALSAKRTPSTVVQNNACALRQRPMDHMARRNAIPEARYTQQFHQTNQPEDLEQTENL